MSGPTGKCVGCPKITDCFNYGVFACNACTQVFRRAVVSFKLDNCPSAGSPDCNCRLCRFRQIMTSGMKYSPFDGNRRHEYLVNLVRSLAILQQNRNRFHASFYIDEDPTFDDVVERDFIRYKERPAGFVMSLNEWGFVSGLTSVDHIKQFNFVKLLDVRDRKLLIKATYYPSAIFASAMRAIQAGQSALSAPDGSDVLERCRGYVNPNFERRIRCRLIARMRELNITDTEFLLLSVLIFCNPAVANFTPSSRSVLGFFRSLYSSALLQNCQLSTSQTGAPSRFTDLLSLIQVVLSTYQDMFNHYLLCKIAQPELRYKRFFGDC